MQGFAQIQFQIGAWTMERWQDYETPCLRVRQAGTVAAGIERQELDRPGRRVRYGEVVTSLNSLAPLLSVAARNGLLVRATELEETADVHETLLGMITVQLCDYCCREGVSVPERPSLSTGERLPTAQGITINVARLLRITLDKMMRAGGMHQGEVYERARYGALRRLMGHLEAHASKHTPTNLLTILNVAWAGIVKNDADAAEVATR